MSNLSLSLCLSQRVLEADAAEDAFNDDDDYEIDTPKRRHRGKGRVSDQMDTSCTTESVLSGGVFDCLAVLTSLPCLL